MGRNSQKNETLALTFAGVCLNVAPKNILNIYSTLRAEGQINRGEHELVGMKHNRNVPRIVCVLLSLAYSKTLETQSSTTPLQTTTVMINI